MLDIGSWMQRIGVERPQVQGSDGGPKLHIHNQKSKIKDLMASATPCSGTETRTE
jgi:hypothetical protein